MTAGCIVAVVIVLLVLLFVSTNLSNNPFPEKFTIDRNLRLSNVRGLVLSSAGIRGYSLLGAIEELIHSGLDLAQLTHFAGTSAGSLICALLACRIPFSDIKDFIINLDISVVTKKTPKITNTVRDKGLYDGDIIENLIDQIITKHTGVQGITLAQTYEKYGSHVIMCTVDLKAPLDPYYLSRHNHPDLPIAKAARMSSSIPLIFTPSAMDEKIFADGGVVDCYPIKELQKSGLPLSKIIGVKIDYDALTNREEWKKIMHALGVSMSSIGRRLPRNNLNILEKQHTVHVMAINKTEHSMINFNVGDDVKQELFDMGRESAKKFLLGSTVVS